MAYNLQGIVRKASTNLITEFDRLAYATQNFANINTNGYKAVRFEDVIDADGSVHGVERIDCKSGEFLITNNPLDIAVQGAGYIPVTTTNGEIKYTRDGAFMKNKDGFLVTKMGDLVGSGIKISATCEKIDIKPNGDVFTYEKLTSEPDYQGTIPLVQFENPEGLKDVGGNNFIATENSGKMKLLEDHQNIRQNGIERSNVDIFSEVYMISRMNASIIATTKLMRAVDQMYEKAINISD